MHDTSSVSRIHSVKKPPEDHVGVEARIYQSVVDGVMSQRLRPGTKLPESALCELFGVGRTSVQKALQRLAHDHVVQLRPNRGAIIAMPTRDEVSMLFEARRGLESAIVPLAARHATADDYTALRRQLRAEHAAMHRAPQAEWARLASAFHLKLAELSRNPFLERYLTELISRCALVVSLFQPPGNATCEHEEHERVINAMERGDVEQAVVEMTAHLSELESHIHLTEPVTELRLADMLGMS